MRKFLFLILILSLAHSCRTPKTPVASNPPKQSKDSLYLHPYAYFQFERSQFIPDAKGVKRLHDATGKKIYYNKQLVFSDTSSPVGSCWLSGNDPGGQTILFDNATPPAPKRVGNFLYEVALRFDPDSMDVFRMGFANGQIVISPGSIQFALVDSTGKADKTERLTITAKHAPGLTKGIYDGKWHHFAFRFQGALSVLDGSLQVWIDGGTSHRFEKKTKRTYSYAGNRFTTGFWPADHSTGNAMDELGIWNALVAGSVPVLHSVDFFAGRHYREVFAEIESVPNLFPDMLKGPKQAGDSFDYAPGYPDYTVSQLEQLQSFPLPRYKPGATLRRNFPWYDFTYLAYDYSKAEEDSTGRPNYPGWKGPAHAAMALAIDTEMYAHWNYLFHIPSPTFQVGDFAKPKTISGTLARYADQHPEIQVSTILFWTGVSPARAGFESKKPYIRTNAAIDPCGDTAYPDIAKDGLAQRRNLELLMRQLPHRDSLRRIDFINENGEVFGESRTPNAEGYRDGAFIRCIQPDPSTARADRARWQYEVFSTYSSQFANTKAYPALLNTKFSFYQVSGMMPQYYSEWREMRKINARFRGDYYSTPDFYPGKRSWNMWETHGPYHGLDVIEQARKYEVASGDNYFSPFICAGWWEENTNYRPSEWLAATKALAMMGAEFFYPAYFNTANPNKQIPNDPRGYMWQVAIPAYAQAVTSRYEDIFLHSNGFVYERNYTRLLIYRSDTLRQRFVLHASTLSEDGKPVGSASGNVTIGGDVLKIHFRPQGNTFIYDKSDPKNVVFYQLDAWHERTHPYYWMKSFQFEAELSDDAAGPHLRTERPAGAAAGDYTQFNTYVYFPNAASTKAPVTFHFEPRANGDSAYYIWIHARSSKDNPKNFSSVQVMLDGKPYTIAGIQRSSSYGFSWYTLKTDDESALLLPVAPGKTHVLQVFAGDRYVEIDKVVLSAVSEYEGGKKEE